MHVKKHAVKPARGLQYVWLDTSFVLHCTLHIAHGAVVAPPLRLSTVYVHFLRGDGLRVSSPVHRRFGHSFAVGEKENTDLPFS